MTIFAAAKANNRKTMKDMKKEERLFRGYVRPEAEELPVSLETNILSGNVEDPDDPGVEEDM